MKKRLLSLLLVLAMIVSIIPAQVYAQAGTAWEAAVQERTNDRTMTLNSSMPFSDVSSDDWFNTAVDYVYRNEIFSGTSAETFSPQDGMTRAMFVTTLGRFAGIDPDNYPGNGGFSDVSSDAYYAPYVAWAVDKGITAGIGDGLFGVDNLVTREQMAVFAVNFMRIYDLPYHRVDSGKTPPLDIDTVSVWAREAVLTMWNADAFNGDAQGNFNPHNTATRAEAAAFYLNLDNTTGARDGAAEKTEQPAQPAPPANTENSGNSHNSSGGSTCTVRFESGNGSDCASVTVRKGTTLDSLPQPTQDYHLFLGWYTDPNFSENTAFYLSTPVYSNLTLYAKYAQIGTDAMQNLAYTQQTGAYGNVSIDSDGNVTGADPVGVSQNHNFIIISSTSTTPEDVMNNIIFESLDHKDDRTPTISGSGTTFTVSMDGGFIEGANYKLTLDNDNLSFSGQDVSLREQYFFINKTETFNLALNKDLIAIPSAQIKDIKRDNQPVDSLFVSLYDIDMSLEGSQSNVEVSGSFTYTGSTPIQVGDSLCIYDLLNPLELTDAQKDADTPAAYITVTSVSGSQGDLYVEYEESDPTDVIFTAETFPIAKNVVTYTSAPSGEGNSFEFSVTEAALALDMQSDFGLDATSTIDVGDYVVVFPGDADEIAIAPKEEVVYGEVTDSQFDAGTQKYTLICTQVTEADMIAAFDYYTQSDVDVYDAAIPNLDQVLARVVEQTLESDMIQDLANNYTLLAIASGSLDELVPAGSTPSVMMDDGTTVPISELPQVLAANNNKKVSVGKVNVSPSVGKGQVFNDNALRVTLAISFTVTIKLDDKGDEVISLKFAVTFTEEISVVINASANAIWKKKWIIPYIADYQVNVDLDVKTYTQVKFTANMSTKSDANMTDITSKINSVLSLVSGKKGDAKEINEGVREIYEIYTNFLKAELDYVKIVDKEILVLNYRLLLGLIHIRFTANFVVQIAANACVGVGITYIEGTRYSFWAQLAGDSGIGRSDILTKTFAFDVFVAGNLGLRVGIELELAAGLVCVDSNSVGLSAEAGLYVKLFGFFHYNYTIKGNRNVSTANGAVYAEFGVYAGVHFRAHAGKYVYAKPIFENEWPLLSGPHSKYIYDFTHTPEADEIIIFNQKNHQLPNYLFEVTRLNLSELSVGTELCTPSEINVYFADNRFSLNGQTLKVNTDEDYLETTMTIAYKDQNFSFTNTPISRTYRVIYTTDANPVEKRMVVVKLTDGTEVYRNRVAVGETITNHIPSYDEVLSQVGYDSYNETVNGALVNLKYDDAQSATFGYGNTSGKVTGGSSNLEFIFTLPLREYAITIDDVQASDGTTVSEVFTAHLNENFDFSSLANTGTNIPETLDDTTADGKFTKFVSIGVYDGADIDPNAVPAGRVDRALAIQLLENNHTYAAQYEDNSFTITYEFYIPYSTDTIAPAYEVIKKGTLPQFDFAARVASEHTGTGGKAKYLVFAVEGDLNQGSSDRTITITTAPTDGYDIIYHLNGGSWAAGSPVLKKYIPASYNILPTGDEMLERDDGLIFSGWYTDEACIGDPLLRITGNEGPIDLYALWVSADYTLVYDLDGAQGEVPPSVPDLNYNVNAANIVASDAGLSKHKYTELTFIDWNTRPDGSGTSYQPNDSIFKPLGISRDGTLVLYPQWRDNSIVEFSSSDPGDFPTVLYPLTEALEMAASGEYTRPVITFGSSGAMPLELTDPIHIPNDTTITVYSSATPAFTYVGSGAPFVVDENTSGIIADMDNVEFDAYFATNYGTLTVRDSSIASTVGGIQNMGTLILDNFTFEMANDAPITDHVIYNDGSLTMNYDDIMYTLPSDGVVANSLICNDENGELTLTGLATQRTFSDVSYAGDGAVFYNAGDLTLTNVSFQDIQAENGSAIYNEGTLTFNAPGSSNANRSFYLCEAAESGGSIYNSGTAQITSAYFHTSTSSDNGGAICNSGDLTITDSVFDACTVDSGGKGGAIYSDGSLEFEYTGDDLLVKHFINCTATYGGAIYTADDTATITNAKFETCSAAKGGAVYNEGDATLTGTHVFRTSAEDGGAIYNIGELQLNNFTVELGEATHSGGIVYNDGELTINNSKLFTTQLAINSSGFGDMIYNSEDASLTINRTIFDSYGTHNEKCAIYNLGIVELSFVEFQPDSSNYGWTPLAICNGATGTVSGTVMNAIPDYDAGGGTVDLTVLTPTRQFADDYILPNRDDMSQIDDSKTEDEGDNLQDGKTESENEENDPQL